VDQLLIAANADPDSRLAYPRTLREYERQQRPRVIAAHENSRQLARLMFRDGRVICTLRDIAMRGANLRMALRPIINLHRGAPL